MKRKRKIVSLLLFTLIATLLLVSCGNGTPVTTDETQGPSDTNKATDSEITTTPEEEKPSDAFNPDTETDTISYDQLEAEYGPLSDLDFGSDVQLGVILKNHANEFWLALGDGMSSLADDYSVTVDIQATRTETDTAGQLSIIETMLQNEYDALILSPLTNENLDSAVATAKADDVPVVNTNCEYIAQADVFVGGRQIEIGQKAAQYIAEKLDGKGKVAIIEGVSGTFTSIQRVNGFNEEIAKYPDIEVVASVPADYEMEKGMNVASDILTQNPDIDALFCCNDNMALGAVEALRAVDKIGEVIVTGADGTGDAYKSIHAGELTATVDQFPDVNGKASIDVALRLLAGQKLPRVVSTPIEIVDVNNASEFGK